MTSQVLSRLCSQPKAICVKLVSTKQNTSVFLSFFLSFSIFSTLLSMKALNNLQATHTGFGSITTDNVFKVNNVFFSLPPHTHTHTLSLSLRWCPHLLFILGVWSTSSSLHSTIARTLCATSRWRCYSNHVAFAYGIVKSVERLRVFMWFFCFCLFL